MLDKKKTVGLVCLSVFAMMQISACFVAANYTDGFVSFFYYCLGCVSCLFGLVLDLILLVLAIDIFGSVFSGLASNIGKINEDDEEEDDEEEISE